MSQPKIYDQQGQERDWHWLASTFGEVQLERAEAADGTGPVYRVVRLQDAEGPATQIVEVVDQAGNSLEGVKIVRHWPDAPPLPEWPAPISRWRERGVYGPTGGNGDIGFGMGHGDYYILPQSGASAVWIADEAGPSDFVGGLGMLGGTVHRHLDVYYQLQEGDVPPPPPPPPPSPPPPPPPPPEDKWEMVMEKLDRIIALLESHLEP